MNIIFLGSSKFAVCVLSRILSSSHRIITVVTQPDRKAGRGMSLISTAVKQLAQKSNLPIYPTENVNSKESLEFLKNLKPDLLCVVAFGQILGEDVLAIPKTLCINLHASLLPKYRGAAPIRWALIKGEAVTGVTVIKVVKRLDAGPIILQKEARIDDSDDALSLEDRLSSLGSDLIIKAIDLIEAGRHNLITQDENKATLAPKLKKEDGLVNWSNSARSIFNLIRGCVGWPGAFIYYRGKILKIHKATLSSFIESPAEDSPGKILEISKNGIVVRTGQGNLLIEQLQIEGKNKITAEEFMSGYRISVGDNLRDKK